jgi:mRNA interferase RelE/StbE
VSWVCKFDRRALRELNKLDSQSKQDILAYLEERIDLDADPRRFGKRLKANLAGLWRYRVGNYRIICQIVDNELIVLVLAVGHRKTIYEQV